MGKIVVGSPERIDFRRVVESADLRAMITAELGEPNRAGKWSCCFHPDGGNPNLGLSLSGKRFKCWSCGAHGDAIDWVAMRSNISKIEAARQLDPSSNVLPISRPPAPKAATPPPPPLKVLRVAAWHDPQWQAAAAELVADAERRLWSNEGHEALEWLRRRGLADHIIQLFRLGFVPTWLKTSDVDVLGDKDGPRGIKVPRGILIPWPAPHECNSDSSGTAPQWAGLNVRRLMPNISEPWTSNDKYLAVIGSERGYSYPYPELTPGVSCILTEGEIDALLTFQELGHLVSVATTGSATTSPRPKLIAELTGCPFWFIATDHDEPGDKASSEWRQLGANRCRRLFLPDAKDIGEYVQSGGNLREWFPAELKRLGIEPDDIF